MSETGFQGKEQNVGWSGRVEKTQVVLQINTPEVSAVLKDLGFWFPFEG